MLDLPPEGLLPPLPRVKRTPAPSSWVRSWGAGDGQFLVYGLRAETPARPVGLETYW